MRRHKQSQDMSKATESESQAQKTLERCLSFVMALWRCFGGEAHNPKSLSLSVTATPSGFLEFTVQYIRSYLCCHCILLQYDC
jgi:hypothetical protein